MTNAPLCNKCIFENSSQRHHSHVGTSKQSDPETAPEQVISDKDLVDKKCFERRFQVSDLVYDPYLDCSYSRSSIGSGHVQQVARRSIPNVAT